MLKTYWLNEVFWWDIADVDIGGGKGNMVGLHSDNLKVSLGRNREKLIPSSHNDWRRGVGNLIESSVEHEMPPTSLSLTM